jgi:hypothetical protein
MKRTIAVWRWIACIFILIAAAPLASAQDAREALGPKDNPAKARGPHPLAELMKSLHSDLRPELRGKHPRVYVTDADLQQLRERARTAHRELWQAALKKVRALQHDPPPPPAEGRRQQNDVGIGILEAALAYKIEGDPSYLAAAKKYMDAAVSYDVWGYSFNKPNIDLAAGHLLYGLGAGYDLLYNDLTPAERARYRDKLAKQAQILADAYEPKPGRTYSYSQNHVFIPIAGLGVAAYALYDEVPQAPHWAALARAIYDRVLATYTPDGYYYEGFEYWVFATPWIIHYLDAHKHATGEDLFDQPGLRNAHYFMANIMLPGGHEMFDFGDVFEGPLTRARKGAEYERSHPGGHLATNSNLLYRLASEFKDPDTQGVAAWLQSMGDVNDEDFWSLLWFDPSVPATPIEKLPTWHYFPDHEVVFWRTDWTPRATAIAFKCGPPEGHHTAALLKKFRDWHLSAGHAHPDANSFIVFANGKYLTGDSGYAGVPTTAQHNTLLVDGAGQANEGNGHDPWAGFDYDLLNGQRITGVHATAASLDVTGEAATGYAPKLGPSRFERHLTFNGRTVTVHDTIEAAAPHTFTVLLHSDGAIRPAGSEFELGPNGHGLRATIVAPPNAHTEVQDNSVMAPGAPGSVDKGEVQDRGKRLAISTPAPARNATFELRLTIQPWY